MGQTELAHLVRRGWLRTWFLATLGLTAAWGTWRIVHMQPPSDGVIQVEYGAYAADFEGMPVERDGLRSRTGHRPAPDRMRSPRFM